MRRSTTGMQRKMAPSTAPHPEWQNFKVTREERKATEGTSSWWLCAPEQFYELAREANKRFTQTSARADAIAAKDLAS